LSPLRYFQLTVLATVAYCVAFAMDAIDPRIVIPEELGSFIRTALAIAWVVAGGAVMAQEYTRKVRAHFDDRLDAERQFILDRLAEAHEEREYFRERFDALVKTVQAQYDAGYVDGAAHAPMRPELKSVRQ
jgi:hypothetical protein